jgi:hypothetical protein
MRKVAIVKILNVRGSRMKLFKHVVTIIVFLLCSNIATAGGYHYCTGMVKDLVTRGTNENTQVLIEGMNGWARIGYGGESYSDMQDRQFSMLLAAYLAGRPVTVEFDSSTLNCASDHTGMLIRYVRVN